MLTVGRGEAFILNMPPDTTGRIPKEYVDATAKFGQALKAFNTPIAKVVAVVGQGQ
jgi:alpha-L-fucosidase